MFRIHASKATYRYMMRETSSNKGMINHKSVAVISLRRKIEGIKDADDQPRASNMTVNIIKDIYVNGNNEHVSRLNNEIK